MKAYKATYNYKCLDQYFEIGQTYELEGEPILCNNGFHFCPKMSDVLGYYNYIPNEFKLLEIEAVGDIVGEGDKFCTNKIKILREVPMEEWDFHKSLPNGYHEIHHENLYGIECWTEYDEKGNEIHHKDFDGFEYWKEYDENGNVTYFKNSNGTEEWREYDGRGNVIHYKNSNGYEEWYEYDENRNEIHYKSSDGVECWREYDEKGKIIHYKDSNGVEWWREYDEKGKIIHYKNSYGHEY